MPKYIDADEFVKITREWYCEQCQKRKGMKRGKLQFVYEIGGVPCWACNVDDMISDIEDFPAADVEPKQKWVSVEDELPEDHRMVLCYTPVDGYICVGFCLTYDWAGKKLTKWNIVTAMRSTKTLTKKVTHWMEIPTPPKEDKSGEDL